MPNRLPETVTAWLKKYPFIEVVSWDGFTGFRKGITDANSSIFQIYDRWHFIRNAKKQLDSFFSTIVPSSITWTDGQLPAKEIPLTRAEQIIKNRRNRKWELIQEIQQAHDKCKNLSRLAREYKMDRRTIKKYLKMNGPHRLIVIIISQPINIMIKLSLLNKKETRLRKYTLSYETKAISVLIQLYVG